VVRCHHFATLIGDSHTPQLREDARGGVFMHERHFFGRTPQNVNLTVYREGLKTCDPHSLKIGAGDSFSDFMTNVMRLKQLGAGIVRPAVVALAFTLL
jgi:hypothetical protein